MKSTILLAIGASLVFSVTDALFLEKRDNPAVVAFPLERTLVYPVRRFRRDKRSIGTTLNNRDLLYTLTLQLGTPPQTINVQLDTGSSDLVVETSSSNLCTTDPATCSNLGTYNANSSTSYAYLNSDLLIAYAGGDGATGDYALDILNIGGTVVTGMRFGIMYKTTVMEGILGVSYPATEFQPLYNNLPALLVSQGDIQATAYSVWLNDDRGTSGTLLFGGVDTDKYIGNLVTLPLTSTSEFFVTLQGVQITIGGNTMTLNGGSTPGPALLDTGTSTTILPDSLVDSIFTALGANANGDVNCNLASSTTTIDYIFAGITIHVPLSQLVRTGTPCSLAIDKSSTIGGDVILGDTFLSSVYVVFDLDNHEVSIAATNFNSNSQNILQIGKGPNGVPNVPGGGTPAPPSNCDHDNCLRALIGAGATAFCGQYLTTAVLSTPAAISSPCSGLPSRISSGCACLEASPTTLTTVVTPTPTPTPTPAPNCNHNNCLRAIIGASATAFCAHYLTATVATTPAAISTPCSGLPSKISSACSCI